MFKNCGCQVRTIIVNNIDLRRNENDAINKKKKPLQSSSFAVSPRSILSQYEYAFIFTPGLSTTTASTRIHLRGSGTPSFDHFETNVSRNPGSIHTAETDNSARLDIWGYGPPKNTLRVAPVIHTSPPIITNILVAFEP